MQEKLFSRLKPSPGWNRRKDGDSGDGRDITGPERALHVVARLQRGTYQNDPQTRV